ncbi:MAG: lytic transglycosylase domain-containing protein [Magnetospirillum sp.]|nr:lytic transglycosylase domain-containing protein [Magnetospirillum sp.]
MLLDPAVVSMIATCTPAGAAVETIEAVVRVESGGHRFALAVNRPGNAPARFTPDNPAGAAAIITQALNRGQNVDIGLMQVNTRTASRMGIDWHSLIDPCENIRIGTTILQQDYTAALKTNPPGQIALQAALSTYNTGNPWTGFSNGYVAKYYGGLGPTPVAGSPYTADPLVYHNKDFK